MATQSYDERITALVKDLAGARDHQIPNKLFILTDILASVKDDPKASVSLRQQLWELDVLQILHLVIRQDFSLTHAGWKTGARLATILSDICCGLSMPNVPEYNSVVLVECIENLLILARRIQNHFPDEQDNVRRTELLDNHREVMAALVKLVSGHSHLAPAAFGSPWLLQSLISDDVTAATSCLNFILSILRVHPGCFSDVSLETRQDVMDELIYKVTVNTDAAIAGSTVKCILRLCECYSPLVEFMCVRYRGLRALLQKWDDKGFNKTLKKLVQLLEAGNTQRQGNLHLHAAAVTVQSWWRGVNTRSKLRHADAAFAKFHKAFRKQRAARVKKWGDEWQEVELERQMRLKRQRMIRQFHEKQMQILEILPAAKIPAYFDEVEKSAATRIQSVWKGYRQRTKLGAKKTDVLQNRSATRIQRAVRLWLERREARRKVVQQSLKPPGLTDERRVQLLELIKERTQMHQTKAQTTEERENLHRETQEMLARYAGRCRTTRSRHQHREALLARLCTDSQLLLDAPPIRDVRDEDVDMYSSRSVPVAMKAKQDHAQELRLLRQPWWRKLGDEYQDRQYEEESMLVLF